MHLLLGRENYYANLVSMDNTNGISCMTFTISHVNWYITIYHALKGMQSSTLGTRAKKNQKQKSEKKRKQKGDRLFFIFFLHKSTFGSGTQGRNPQSSPKPDAVLRPRLFYILSSVAVVIIIIIIKILS